METGNSLEALFQKNPNINVPERQDSIAKFKVGDLEYDITEHAFERFYERVKNSVSMKAEKERTKSRCLKILYNLLKDSVPVERRNAALQIMKHNYKPADYRFCRGWVIVIEDNLIKSVYEKEKEEVDKLPSGYRYKKA